MHTHILYTKDSNKNNKKMKPLINFKTIITTLFYFSISLHNPQAYDPFDRFILNCGTEGNSTDGERTWTGDTN
jgi:hypothetical protein